MFSSVYKDKTVVVTGHTGFKGAWLCAWLLKLGAKVVGISKDIPTNPSLFETLELDKKIEHNIVDLRDLGTTEDIITGAKPDFIFHLAAQAIVSTSYSNPLETFSTNVMGTAHVLEAMRSLTKPCVGVFITSDKCYDNVEWPWGYRETDHLGGKDIYSGSKGAAELAIKSFYYSFLKDSAQKICSVRAGNVIGGGDWAKDRIVPDCVRAWSNDEVLTIRSPQATRPWQHVLEPLSGYLHIGRELFLSENLQGESYNFGPNFEESITVSELIEDIAEIWGKEPKTSYKVEGNVPFHEAKLLKLNCDKALLDFKWRPTLDYKNTVSFVGSWYKKFYTEKSGMWDYTLDQISQYERSATDKGVAWTK